MILQLSLLQTLVAIVFSCFHVASFSQVPEFTYKNLTAIPAMPQAGDVLSIKYTPVKELQSVENIFANVFLLTGTPPKQLKVELVKTGNHYQSTINTGAAAKALVIEFVGNSVKDNNGGEGYFIPFFSNGQVVPEAYAEIARSFGSFSSIVGLKSSGQKVIDYLDQEFTIHPSTIEKLPAQYIRVLQVKKKAYTPETEAFITSLLHNQDNTESILAVVEEYYRIVDKKEKADEINQKIRSIFPKGEWLKKEKHAAFEKEKNLAKKAALYEEALALFNPKTEKEKMDFDDDFTWVMMEILADSGYFDKLPYYDAKMFTDIERAGVYHAIAYGLIGSDVDAVSVDFEKGKFYQDKASQIFKSIKDAPKNMRLNFLSTDALILYKEGKYAEAYKIQKEVVEGFNRTRPNLNEAYTVYMEKALGAAEAKRELELFVKAGLYSRHMKDQLKRIYLSTKPAQPWSDYIAALDKEHLQKMRTELMAMRKNVPAPLFALKDMRGETLSLADLKGKTVVLDFWATWCGPCIASFPAMQTTIDKYKDDPNVVFLFVNTLERVGEAEKLKLIKTLFDKNKYSFNVVLDEQIGSGVNYKVANQYRVNAIPTKVIIDAKGQIVFNEVGTISNTDLIAEELSMMIELAKAAQ